MSNPQTVPDLFNRTRDQWLQGARHTARQLLRRRRSITIEDVLERYPRPKYLHRNTTGSVFKGDMFQPIGYTLSKRTLSHGRVIRMWAMSDLYARSIEPDCEV